MKIIVYTDGGARGNPGPAAVGVVIEKQDESKVKSQKSKELVVEFGKRIGEATNNVAEYTAVLEGLTHLRNNPIIQSTNHPIIQFFLDSILVVNQLNGLFKVKDTKLRELLAQARILEQEVGGAVTYTSVPREENARADFLVNRALDGM